ncbi:MAG: TIGR01841 family phasin [Pseudomonadota bacterium]
MANQFPFAFDPDAMKDMFKMPEMDKLFDMTKMPEFDKFFDMSKMPMANMGDIVELQQKNLNAVVEANKVAVAGYQDLYKRQMSIFEEGLAKAKDQLAEMQGQPLTAEQASKNMETMKVTFEKGLEDVRELAEMAQKANSEAFEIVKARFEEVMAEFKAAADKLAA